MFYVLTCNPAVKNQVIGEYKTEKEAFSAAKTMLEKATDCYDFAVDSTEHGYSQCIGFATTGRIPDCGDESDPCTRGGSVLFGREHE